MKKIVMTIATLVIVATMILPVSAAEMNTPVSYFVEGHETECTLSAPIQAFSLEEMDHMAAAAGYTIAEPDAKDAIRMYIAHVDDITYNVTLYDQMVTKCSHQYGSEIGGTICAMPLYVSEGMVATEFNPETELFNDTISMEAVKIKLIEAGYTTNMSAGPFDHYTKGDETEGSSITVIGDTVYVYNYSSELGQVLEYAISDGIVPIAILSNVIK